MPKKVFYPHDLDSPVRVDQYIARQEGAPSRSALRPLFDQGKVLVNKSAARPSTRVQNGDVISADLPEPKDRAPVAEPIPVPIIFQDQHLVVVEKPSGIITHPTPARNSGTLVNALLHHCGRLSGIGGRIKPGIVHRLDKLTSGVMVAAKTDAAHVELAKQFKEHTIKRMYLALVFGEMEKLEGSIETLITRNLAHRLKMTTRSGQGRRALTHYRVLARAKGFSLIQCQLETGRTHQIRVQLSESNHPVVGDPLYGKGRTVSTRLASHERSAVRHLKRQALHAYYLGFTHPATREWMAFQSPLPEDMGSVLAALDLDSGLDLPATSSRVE